MQQCHRNGVCQVVSDNKLDYPKISHTKWPPGYGRPTSPPLPLYRLCRLWSYQIALKCPFFTISKIQNKDWMAISSFIRFITNGWTFSLIFVITSVQSKIIVFYVSLTTGKHNFRARHSALIWFRNTPCI